MASDCGSCQFSGCGARRFATCEDGRCVCAVGCAKAEGCKSDGCPIIHGSYEESAHDHAVVVAQSGCKLVVMYGQSFLSGSVLSTGVVHVSSFDVPGRIANDSTRIMFGDGAVWTRKRHGLGKGFDGLLSSTDFKVGNLDAFRVPGGLATVWLSNVQCSLPFMGQPVQQFARRSPTRAQFVFALGDIGITCNLDWRVKYRALWVEKDEAGHAIIVAAQNAVNATLDVVSDSSRGLPTGFRFSHCEASATINKVQLSGGNVVALIVNVLEDVIATFVGEEIQSLVCKMARTSGEGTLDPLLGKLSSAVGPHIPCVENRTLAKTVRNQAITMCSEKADVSKVDILSAEKELKSLGNASSRIIDLQNDGLFAYAFKSGANMLGEQHLDTARNESVLGINILMRALTDGTGTAVIRSGEKLTFGKVTASIANVTVRGLDSFTELQPVRAISSWTWETFAKMAGLDVEVGVHISIGEDPLNDIDVIDTSAFQKLTFHLSMTSGIKDINVSGAALSAYDVDELMRTQLGALLKSMVPCLLKPFVAFQFTLLAMSSSTWSVPTVFGIPDTELQNLLSNLTAGMRNIYKWPVLDALPSVSTNLARPWINKQLRESIQTVGSKCKPLRMPESDVPQYMNFQMDPLFRKVRKMLESFSRPDEGGRDVNEAGIGPLTSGMNPQGKPGEIYWNESFWFQFDGFLKGQTDEIVPVSAFSVEGQSLWLSGLNSVYGLDLLQPTPLSQGDMPHRLRSDVGIGRGSTSNDTSSAEPLKLTMDSVQIDFLRPFARRNNVALRLEVLDARVATDMQVLLNRSRLERFQIGQLLSVDCWLSSLPEQGFQLHKPNITVGSFNLSVNCNSCETVGLLDLDSTLRQPQSHEQITDVVNGALIFASALLEGSSFQRWINDRILAAPNACLDWNETTSEQLHNQTDVEEVPSPPPPISFIVFIVLLAGFLVSATCTAWAIYRSTQRYRVRHVQHEQTPRASSLAEHVAVPCAVRIGVVVALLAGAAFYLQGHLMSVGLVRLTLHVAGEALLEDDYNKFTFGNAVVELYNRREYVVAIVLLLLSGLWPYVKIGILMYAWCARPKLEDLERRGRVVRWLDKLGKFSMLDFFVLMFCLIAFRFRLRTPNRWTFLPIGFFGADAQLEVCWGFHAYMLAQLVSQIVCHVVIYFHQVAAASDVQAFQLAVRRRTTTACWEDPSLMVMSSASAGRHTPGSMQAIGTENRVSVASFALRAPSVGLRILHPLLKIGVPAALCCVCVLVVWGTVVPVFRIDVAGILGVLMDFAEPGSRSTRYSVVDIVWAISSEKRPSVASYFGAHFLLLFMLCAVIIPVALASALVVLWLVPLSLPSQAKHLFVLETMTSWQYVLVFLLAIFFAVMQLIRVSESNIQACAQIDGMLADLGRSGLLQPGDDRCFALKAVPETGFYLLGVGGLLLVVLRRITFQIIAAADAASEALPTECKIASAQDKLESMAENISDGWSVAETASMRGEGAFETPTESSVVLDSEEATTNPLTPSSTGEAPASWCVPHDEEAPAPPSGVVSAPDHVPSGVT